MARQTGAAITFNDAIYMVANEGFEARKTIPSSNKTMTKADIDEYLKTKPTLYSAYPTNKLVPYQLVSPMEVISLAWRAINSYCVTEVVEDMLLILTSTNPTNPTNNNGSATVEVVNGNGPFTYSWSNGSSTPTTSTRTNTISGLSGGATYTVTVKDSLNHTVTESIIIGQTQFLFDADYVVLTFAFSDGKDLDIRAQMVHPKIINTIGYGKNGVSVVPSSQNPILQWGGDNVGYGSPNNINQTQEAVLVNLVEYKKTYFNTDIIVDCRAFWFSTKGVNPVEISAVLYKGGTMVAQGMSGNPKNGFANPTATGSFQITSASKVITEKYDNQQSLGERIATFKYDIATGRGLFDTTDITNY